MINRFHEEKKGFLLYLALALSGAFVLVAAAISSIMIGELSMSVGAKKSMEAISNAASLLDLALYEIRINEINPSNINCAYFSSLPIGCGEIVIDPNYTGVDCPYLPSNDCTKVEAIGVDKSGKIFRKLTAIYGNL